MITKEEYESASALKKEAEEVMRQYHVQKAAQFKERMTTNPTFSLDELRFSRTARCPCGAGLAYPIGCGAFHYWDCSALLLGTALPGSEHTARLPFTFYDVKSEEEGQVRATTRPGVSP